MNLSRPLTLLGAALLWCAAACDWPWPYDDPNDPFRCDPPCSGKGVECIDGECVVPPDMGVDAWAPGCGDEKCELGETIKSCPQDCKPCGGKKSKCEGAAVPTISGCHDGAYMTFTCDDICKQNKYGFATACLKKADGGAICQCGGGLGYAPCIANSKSKPCGEGLRCVKFPGFIQGYCSRYCTSDANCTGAPANFNVKCALKVDNNTKTVCAFVCANKEACPNYTKCSADPKFKGICQPL